MGEGPTVLGFNSKARRRMTTTPDEGSVGGCSSANSKEMEGHAMRSLASLPSLDEAGIHTSEEAKGPSLGESWLWKIVSTIRIGDVLAGNGV